MAHTLYCDKNFAEFRFTNCMSYLPGSSGWTDQYARYTQGGAYIRVYEKYRRKSFANTYICKIDENFLLAKIPHRVNEQATEYHCTCAVIPLSGCCV